MVLTPNVMKNGSSSSSGDQLLMALATLGCLLPTTCALLGGIGEVFIGVELVQITARSEGPKTLIVKNVSQQMLTNVELAASWGMIDAECRQYLPGTLSPGGEVRVDLAPSEPPEPDESRDEKYWKRLKALQSSPTHVSPYVGERELAVEYSH